MRLGILAFAPLALACSPSARASHEASAAVAAVRPANSARTPPHDAGEDAFDAADASISAEADAGSVLREEPPVVIVEYVNLNVDHATMRVDARGRATYSTERRSKEHDAIEPLRETAVSREVLDQLVEEARQLCNSPPHDDEGMTWTRVVVELPDARCNVRLTPSTWKQRLPAFVRAVGAVEQELCGVLSCRRPLF